MTMEPVKLGIIGCGNISGIYCQNAQKLEALDLVACADLIPERAEAKAREFDIPKAYTPEELLADPEIEIILNLTIPNAHEEVALSTLAVGKHVYNEKPLAITREAGRRVVEMARQKGLRVGCAPDTFLGGGIQTCRKLVDDGMIGQPVGATAFMMCHGHESWHPDPEFYYDLGGGPMLDMGPYYLTALVNLMGPVRRVTGSTAASFPARTITSEPKHGQVIEVRTPTHLVGVLDFAEGGIGTIVTSFDVWAAEVPRIEIYGSLGTLSVPDPNTFGGPVRLWREGAWHTMSLTHGYDENSRGLGVADMAMGVRSGRPHRANGDLAYHVLDVMQAIDEASQQGCHVKIESSCERPAALPVGLARGRLDT